MTTRRRIVCYRPGSHRRALRALEGLAGRAAMLGAVILPRLGIALVDACDQGAAAIAAAEPDSALESVHPENEARCAALDLAGAQAQSRGPSPEEESAGSTWGLRAVLALTSQYTGRGVRVAILDTGFDSTHPDFVGRQITYQGFAGDPKRDAVGHGTHCVGTSCGPARPASGGPRYGIAHEAEIFVGKVLDDTGKGGDGTILQGIEWALSQGCRVISMSLEGPPAGSYPYERAARAGLAHCAVIAAAGNDSHRPAKLSPVGSPGDSPCVMACAAVDKAGGIAPFSNASGRASGAEVDLAAPGVEVYSTWPGGHNVLSGTSMATPHVAGIAALIAQAKPEFSGDDIMSAMMEMAEAEARTKPSGLNKRDAGSGLAVCP